MFILLRSLALFILLVAYPAEAQTVDVSQLDSGMLTNILFSLVLALIALTWRSHKAEYKEYKEQIEKHLTKIEAKQESSLNREEFNRMQMSLHQSLDNLRGDFSKWRSEDNTANTRLVNELYEDIKEQRQEQRRVSEEVWRQIADHREKFGSFELKLAGTYHTKPEINQLLDDKLAPILNELRRLNSNTRGHAR